MPPPPLSRREIRVYITNFVSFGEESLDKSKIQRDIYNANCNLTDLLDHTSALQAKGSAALEWMLELKFMCFFFEDAVCK